MRAAWTRVEAVEVVRGGWILNAPGGSIGKSL